MMAYCCGKERGRGGAETARAQAHCLRFPLCGLRLLCPKNLAGLSVWKEGLCVPIRRDQGKSSQIKGKPMRMGGLCGKAGCPSLWPGFDFSLVLKQYAVARE